MDGQIKGYSVDRQMDGQINGYYSRQMDGQIKGLLGG